MEQQKHSQSYYYYYYYCDCYIGKEEERTKPNQTRTEPVHPKQPDYQRRRKERKGTRQEKTKPQLGSDAFGMALMGSGSGVVTGPPQERHHHLPRVPRMGTQSPTSSPY